MAVLGIRGGAERPPRLWAQAVGAHRGGAQDGVASGTTSIASQFGAILRNLRTAQGLFQEELTFRAGMSVPYLSDLERGRSNPSLAMVVDLACALATHRSVMLAGLIIEGAQSRRGASVPRTDGAGRQPQFHA
ncbi:helix-turn-helix domain-containing protein [Azospirillum formosense]|uniref:Helix-turn-helix domain-containing protein n=1 Tax=Azospirillum formosense TaxID=861533 RepID=A0ABX2KSW3_9PROT|nr:helix-turn-helix transcriptional regulator [Azospirillum formosense]NUB18723.1 helix-turn-helix domain-containing protein [Azospirillum formosense]